MKISKRNIRDAKQIFRAVLSEGLLDEAKARQALKLIATQKPRGYLSILTHFQRLVRLEQIRRSALVESAEPLSAEMQGVVRENLTRRYGPGLNFSFSTRPELLGGLRVKVDSDVYDGSVQARLAALAQSF